MDMQEAQALTEEERSHLIQAERRRYNREYMRKYRANKDKQAALKRHQENYWLRQGLRQVEVRSIDTLEHELQQLKQRAEVLA